LLDFLRGGDVEVALAGIEHHARPLGEVQQTRLVGEDQREIERAGQHRDVRGDAAREQDDAADLLQAELEHLGREQLGRDGDAPFPARLGVAVARQIGQEAAAHVHDVVALFSHVRVVHALEALDVFEDHAIDPFRGRGTGRDLLLHGAQPALIA
jgi:hypothetical protein